MTTKRFVKTHYTINWWAVLDNGKELLEDEVVELLNKLYEENQVLKSSNLEYEDIFGRLEEENERLKQQLKDCTAKAKEEIRKQEEENAIRWANIGM